MKKLITFLLLTLAIRSLQAADAEAVSEQLEARWFETEVIIFEHPGVGETFEDETLTHTEPRHFPEKVLLLANTPYPFSLEPETAEDAYRFQMGRGIEAIPIEREEEPQVIIRQAIDEEAEEPNPSDLAASNAEELVEMPEPSAQELFDSALTEFEATLYEQALQPLETLALSEQVAKLSWQDRHRILWHQRWLQPVPSRGEPLPIMVQTGPTNNNLHELEGTLALTIGRYLHLHATLWLQALPQEELAAEASAGEADLSGDASINLINEETQPVPVAAPERHYFLLDESRRMRSGEMHYIDHPRFGVLVRIDPVAIPETLIASLEAVENASD